MGRATAMATVPARPDAFTYQPERTALIVVDMQLDYCSPEGSAAQLGRDVSRVRHVIPAVVRAVDKARQDGLTVIFTREGHRADLSDCPLPKLTRSRLSGAEIGGQGPLGRRLIRGESGNQLVPQLTIEERDILIDKPGKGAFYATDLDLVLRTRLITHLIFCGISTNVCVHSTVREATDRGYWNLILEDACGAYDQTLHDAAIRLILAGRGIFGSVATLSDFLSQQRLE